MKTGFSGQETGEAVSWAIQVLLDDLRLRNQASGTGPANEPQTAQN